MKNLRRYLVLLVTVSISLVRSQTCTTKQSPYMVGCADGTREWFFNVTQHPLIAGCSGAWSVPGIRSDAYTVRTTPTCNRAAGNTGTVADGNGCSAVDLCAEGWRICSDAMDVETMSGSNDCDDLSNFEHTCSESNAFFASGQGSQGQSWCAPGYLNDIYGCGKQVSGNMVSQEGNPSLCGPNTVGMQCSCNALNRLIYYGVGQAPWNLPAANADSELRAVTKTGNALGGVLCCKNVSSQCSAGQYSRRVDSGCADGTREYFSDRSLFPDIAGCSGGWSVPGIKAPVITVSTIAGSGSATFADGTGSSASFGSSLQGLAIDSSGNVFVADGSLQRIRRITPTGVVTTFAGSGATGSTDATGTAASFNAPSGLAFDLAGNLLVTDGGSNKIRRITPAGAVSTIAGTGAAGSADGSSTSATFNYPAGVAVDSLGNIFVSECNSHRIRKISTAGTVTTFAGTTQGYLDAVGTAARFNCPSQLAFDSNGNLFVAEYGSNRIRKVTPGGVVSTFAGSGEAKSADGIGVAASLNAPCCLAFDSFGNLFVSESNGNKISKITSDGVVTTFAGTGVAGYVDGNENAAQFREPVGIDIDSSGNFYVVDKLNYRIRKLTLDPSGNTYRTRYCDISGNDSPNPTGAGCAAVDLCEPGWSVCDNARDMLTNSANMYCGASSAVESGSQFFASGLVVNHANCSNQFNTPSVTSSFGAYGCGNVNFGSYCKINGYAPMNSFSGASYSSLPLAWNNSSRNSNFDISQVRKGFASGGGVLCCRNRKETCARCNDANCIDPVRPTVLRVTPSNSSTAGGTTITIDGVYFGNLGSVFVNGNLCPRVAGHYIWDRQVTCMLPAGVGANVSVLIISNITGSGIANFTVFSYNAPVITSIISPVGSRGTAGGATVTLIGANFGATSATSLIYFGESLCREISFRHNHTYMECTLPEGMGTVPVRVLVSHQASPPFMFTYDAPVISSLNGQSGPTSGGTFVTIMGYNFGFNGTVLINSALCAVTNFLASWSHTTILCVLPEGSGLGNPISLLVGGQQASSSLVTYNYANPIIYSILPVSGSSKNLSTLTVTISGANFGPNYAARVVHLGSVTVPSAQVKYISHSQILLSLSTTWNGRSNVVSLSVSSQDSACSDLSNLCALSFSPPEIIYVRGCTNVHPMTQNCPVNGSAVLTVVGYGFGSSSSAQIAVSSRACNITSWTTFSDNSSGLLDSVTCTLPRNPFGGFNLPVSITVGGQSDVKPYVSYRGPSIVSGSLGLCPGGGNGTVVNMDPSGGQYICFRVQNLDGAASSDVTVQYGGVSSSYTTSQYWINCSNVSVADPWVSCRTSVGFGRNLSLRVQVYQQLSALSVDKFSYQDVSLVSESIRPSLNGSLLASYSASSNAATWIFFNVLNLPVQSSASLWSFIRVFYGTPGSSTKEYECTQVQIWISRTGTALQCRLELGRSLTTGVNVFEVVPYNYITSEGIFNFSYPITPTITQVSGCTASGTATVDCPTEGGVTLTISGDNFCDFSTSNCSMQIQIGADYCSPQYVSNKRMTCTLPASSGTNLPVRLFQTVFGFSTFQSSKLNMLSYAKPVITAVTGCGIDSSGETSNCSRSASTLITISGTNFGPSGASVYISGMACSNVTHISPTFHRVVTCLIPPGKDLRASISLVQKSGVVSANSGYASYRQCDPGMFGNSDDSSNLTCYSCGIGRHSPISGATTCSSCNYGTFNPITSQSICQTCSPGTFSRFGAVNCTACDAGKYSSSSGSFVCVQCDSGYFGNQTGLSTCSKCKEGFFASTMGLSVCSACSVGSFAPSSGAVICQICPSGKFANFTAATACFNCAAGSYPGKVSPSDSGNSTCILCPAGKYNSADGQPECLNCPKGTYSPIAGRTFCSSCPNGTAISVQGSSSCSPCPAGQFAPGDGNVQCQSCISGTYSSTPQSDECLLCPAGSYQDRRGMSFCTACMPGNQNNMLGQITCFPCLDGYVAPNIGSTACYQCSAGRYPKLASFYVCEACPIGKYTGSEGLMECSSCPAGKIAATNNSYTCARCPPGTYASGTGQSACVDCDAGKSNSEYGQSLCNICPQGRFSSSDRATGCAICTPGKFQALRGQTVCNLCGAGNYSSLEEQLNCNLCPKGMFSSEPGMAECQSCPVGRYQNQLGNDSCILCPVAQYSRDVRVSVCLDCAPGSYATILGQSSCQDCPAGKYQDLSKQSYCADCAPGKYSSIGSLSCTKCTAGRVAPDYGNAVCFACPPDAGADDDSIKCVCNAGYYSNRTNANSTDFFCVACPVGASCDEQGVTWDSMLTATGYWRPNTDSLNFYRCQFESQCLGGRASSCAANRVGPVCSLCEAGYESFGSSCRACGGATVSTSVFVLMCGLITFLVLAMYFSVLKMDKQTIRKMKKKMELESLPKEDQQDHQEDLLAILKNDDVLDEPTIDGAPPRPPNFVYKLKILLGFFQIAVGIAFAVEIPWPDSFKQFIALFNIANFDLVQWTRAGCVVQTNYFTKHLLVCALPIVLFVALVVFYLLPKFIYASGSSLQQGSKLEKMRSFHRGVRKFWKMVFFTMFLIYPSVSSIIVRLYSCTSVEGISYLSADFRIRCDSQEWKDRAIFNLPFVVLYPFGFLALFAVLLFTKRHELGKPETLVLYGFLYGAYSHDRWWFELIDMFHKLTMTSIIALIPSDYALRAIMGILVLYTMIILAANPYSRKGDDRLHLLVQAVLFVMVLAGYVYRTLGDPDNNMDNALSIIFIGMTLAVVGYVILQIIKVARKYYTILRRKRRAQSKKNLSLNSPLSNPHMEMATTADVSLAAFETNSTAASL